MDFEKFWEAKMEAKIDFWDVFFFDIFGGHAFVSILGYFWEAPNPENMHSV